MFVLAAMAASCVGGELAYAGARPGIDGIFSGSLFEAKTAVGQDGLYRLLWDYNPAPAPGPSTYGGSALWIVDPNGGVVAAGSPLIPASVGATFFPTSFGSRNLFLFERSNTAIFAQPSGNTTILFYYGLEAPDFTTNSLATWTYNSSGALIAAAAYGPFSGATVRATYFDPSGKIIVRWDTGKPFSTTSYAAWVLDEFGTIQSSTSFFGPFGITFLGKIRVNSSGQQIWPFKVRNADGTYVTTIWTFNSTGSGVTNAQVFGPF